jgi:phosphoribosylformylglycinamidine cyclo-ligase
MGHAMTDSAQRYTAAGVDTGAATTALGRLAASVNKTLILRDGRPGRPIRGLGYYANVLDLGGGLGLAVSTDGVGTKLLVAEMMDRYDTVGIDCVAMNVNDLICVGAEPIAMLDYVAVGKADPRVFEEVGKGLLLAAQKCRISIPGGETAMVGEMLKGSGRSEGFDLVGTAVGLVPIDRAMFGQDVTPGDVIIGVASAGLHSNGYSLARKVLLSGGATVETFEPAFKRTVGEEMLEPTALYVALAVELFDRKTPVHALCHITGDGYMNLARVEAKVGFVLDDFPEWPAVFSVIAEKGAIGAAEMYTVFNMGIGLCVMLPEAHAATVLEAAKRHGFEARRLGYVTGEAGVVRIPQWNLVGTGAKGTGGKLLEDR